jgi:3-deoxy-7-phosphoheptulonate synthase
MKFLLSALLFVPTSAFLHKKTLWVVPPSMKGGGTTFGRLPPSMTMTWKPSSWKTVPKHSSMIPKYFEDTIYQHITDKLKKSAPIIFAPEATQLENELAYACLGKRFVLIGGDCVETFEDSNVNKVWNDFSLFIRLSFLLTYGLEMPVVKIQRIAGQFAKPRSQLLETRNNTTFHSYQGDIINSINFTQSARTPDPIRMLEAYHLSVQTLNIIRGFTQGGYTDVYNYKYWENSVPTHFTQDETHNIYRDIMYNLRKSLRFFKALGVSSSNKLRDAKTYIGHEALLLPYEECLVRTDSISGHYYDCSAHFLWIGERTRDEEGPHVEFCKGITNPIGVKISTQITPQELLNLTKTLNPENKPGRLSLIVRMGSDKIRTYLPALIKVIQQNNRHVVWICDPMHGNTKSVNGSKTRYFGDIWNEIMAFFEIHWDNGSIPGGLHLEMTGKNVTECMGGYLDPITDLSGNYDSLMDPRLNPTQTMEIMMLLSRIFQMKGSIDDAFQDSMRTYLNQL